MKKIVRDDYEGGFAWDSKIDKAAYVITISFVLFLLFFGWRFHWIEEVNTSEDDGYVGRAEQIRLGNISTFAEFNDSCDSYVCRVLPNLPVDPYRPYLYPILSAGVGALLNDTFAGARLTSTLFAGLAVLFTYWLGRQYFSKEVGLFAVLAIILSHVFIQESVRVTTDMTFVALTLMTIFFSVHVNYKPELTSVLILALSFALAFFTRYTAIALFPGIIFSLIYTPSLSKKKTLINLVAFIVATAVFLLPHFIITTYLFGHPFYNENWKNLAFKLYGNWDWSYYERIPFDGLVSVIAYSPTTFLRSTLNEFLSLTRSDGSPFGLIELGGGGRLAGNLFFTLLLAGVYDAMSFLDRKRVIILSFIAVTIVMVCTLFIAFSRLMLPLLPLGYLLGGHFLIRAFPGSIHFKNINIQRYIPVAAFFLIILCVTTLKQLPQFIARHPVKELEAALMLQENHGSEITVLGTFPFLQRYLQYNYYYLDDPHGDEVKRKNKYYTRLKANINEMQADYIIVGRLTLNGRPRELLATSGSDIPPFLKPIFHNDDVAVYEVKMTDMTSERMELRATQYE